MMRFSALLGYFLIFVSCDRVSSRLENQRFDSPEAQKVQCSAKIQNSCWAASVSLLQDCLGESQVGQMSEDLRFCQSSDGLLVHFIRPPQNTKQAYFDVYKNGEKCFRLEKSGESLTISQTAFGELKVSQHENGDMQIDCFFGEKSVISSEFAGACLSAQTGAESPPKASLKTTEKDKVRHFMFSFVGLGLPSLPVFNCQSE